jgi:polysaccharide export outer membrane protein
MPQAGTQNQEQAGPGQNQLQLGGGDLIEVSVYGVPDLTAKGRISKDGDFYMPLVGYVRIGGLSAEDAQAAIEKKYVDGGFLKNPHVTINVLEYVTEGVSLLGEVSKPGIYPVLGDRRLFDIISAAGGFTPAAGRTITITHRSAPQTPVVVTFTDTPDKATDANVAVEPGDTIMVSRAQVCYVVGEVGHPAEILMQNKGLTVLKALAISGGPTGHAKLDGAKIIRRANGATEEIRLPLKEILTAKAKDVEMMPEDILFVPGRNITAIQTILGMATGLAMRVPF